MKRFSPTGNCSKNEIIKEDAASRAPEINKFFEKAISRVYRPQGPRQTFRACQDVLL
jgi:hypothetical protein